MGDPLGKGQGQLNAGVHLRGRNNGISCGGWVVADAQKQHRQNGTDAGEGYHAEAVLLGAAVPPGGGHADAQGHNKGNRYGPGGDPSGIESYRQKAFGGEEGHHKDQQVEAKEQMPQLDLKEGAEHG